MVHDDRKLLEFPCDFPIKMMGKNEPSFHDAARSVVEHHAGPIDETAVRTSNSRNGRFVSMTVTIRAVSQQQLDAIYVDLTAHDEILVAL